MLQAQARHSASPAALHRELHRASVKKLEGGSLDQLPSLACPTLLKQVGTQQMLAIHHIIDPCICLCREGYMRTLSSWCKAPWMGSTLCTYCSQHQVSESSGCPGSRWYYAVYACTLHVHCNAPATAEAAPVPGACVLLWQGFELYRRWWHASRAPPGRSATSSTQLCTTPGAALHASMPAWRCTWC